MLVLNGGSGPSDKGGRGDDQPDPEIRGTPVSKKYFFGPVWFKNKGGGGGPRASPLDPPLVLSGGRETFLQFFARREEKMNSFRYKCPIKAHMMTKYSLFIRMLFCRSRLNILIFLSIL